LVAAINSLQWINVTNSLIATGEQDVLSKLKDLVQSLDVPLKQVFIEVLIIETSLNNLQNFGVQWGSLGKYRDKVALGFGNFPGANPLTGSTGNMALSPPLRAVNATTFPNPNTGGGTGIPFVNGFDLGSIGDIVMHKGRSFISLGALVQALQTDADSTISLNPKLICQDTNNSTIFVGQNIPYTGSTLNVSGGINTSVTSNIEYRDIGMNLSITPYLGNGDVVTLEISNDLSTQINASSNQNIPPNGILTTHTSLNTRVHVPDKHFLVLSGMITDSKTHFKSGIPCLGGLPVIGAAFSENDRADTKNNVIIFIRPQIIHSYNEYKEITEHQENLYKDEMVLPVMKEEFDEGINLVKQPENE
jgi:type III secretion protein C